MSMFQKTASYILRASYKNLLQSQADPLAAQERAYQELRRRLLRHTKLVAPEVRESENLQEFAKRSEVRTYKDYEWAIQAQCRSDEKILFDDELVYVGLSSASTSPKSKAIPYNQAMFNAWKNFQFVIASIVEASSSIKMLSSSRLTWGSTPVVEEFPGEIPGGYVSGFLSMKSPWLMRRNGYPRASSLMLSSMEEKMRRMESELRGVDLQLVSGVPSYLLNLFEHLKTAWGVSTLSQAFPHLSTCIYSSTPIHAWRDQIDAAVGRPLQYIGCYAATEAGFGYEIPELSSGQTGLYHFHLDDFVFLFRKRGAEDRLLTIDELREGDEVELLLSSPNGLINYAMGDLLRIESEKPNLRFEVLGRIGQGMNIAAEKVSSAEIQRLIQVCAQKLGEPVRHFFVHPGRSAAGRPNYNWTIFIDGKSRHSDKSWALELDKNLMQMNEDYLEARLDLCFIDEPSINLVESSQLRKFFNEKSSRGQLKLQTIFESKEKSEAYFSEFHRASA